MVDSQGTSYIVLGSRVAGAPVHDTERQATVDVRHALNIERFGDPGSLRAEYFTGRRRGLDARRCVVCHDEHDQAVREGRGPQPVRRAQPGSDRCVHHQGEPGGGRR